MAFPGRFEAVAGAGPASVVGNAPMSDDPNQLALFQQPRTSGLTVSPRRTPCQAGSGRPWDKHSLDKAGGVAAVPCWQPPPTRYCAAARLLFSSGTTWHPPPLPPSLSSPPPLSPHPPPPPPPSPLHRGSDNALRLGRHDANLYLVNGFGTMAWPPWARHRAEDVASRPSACTLITWQSSGNHSAATI